MNQPGSRFGKAYFEGYYRGYRFEKLYYFWARRLAKSVLSVLKSRYVLDVGCAKGFLVLSFRELGAEAFGIDVSGYAITRAPTQVRQYLHVSDANQDTFPFGNGRFDLVTMLDTMEHLRDYGHALQETRRCLSPDGMLFVTVPSRELGSVDPTHVSLFDRHEWIEEFRKYGFEENSRTDSLKRRIGVNYRIRALCSLRGIGDVPRISYELLLAITNVFRRNSLVFLLSQSN